MTEGVHAAIGIDLHFIAVCEHDAAGSHRRRNHSAPDDSISDRARRLIPTASYHRNAAG